MINWIKENRDSVIRNSFLLPIILVVIMSISHVISWYDIGNPITWAIYLSIAIEIFALASVSASSIKMSRASIWFLFGLVTIIQIIGNIFYGFKDIDPNGKEFGLWIQLIEPLFTDWEVIDHRRFLAAIQGGTLPLMSLTALHFYIKFGDSKSDDNIIEPELIKPQDDVVDIEEPKIYDRPDGIAIDEISDANIEAVKMALKMEARAEEELNKIDVGVSEDNRPRKSSPANLETKDNKQVRDIRSEGTLNKEIDPRTGKYKIM